MCELLLKEEQRRVPWLTAVLQTRLQSGFAQEFGLRRTGLAQKKIRKP